MALPVDGLGSGIAWALVRAATGGGQPRPGYVDQWYLLPATTAFRYRHSKFPTPGGGRIYSQTTVAPATLADCHARLLQTSVLCTTSTLLQ